MNSLTILNLYNQFIFYLGRKKLFEDTPYPDLTLTFPDTKLFEDNFNLIRDEYLNYLLLNNKKHSMVELGIFGGNSKTNLPWNKDCTMKEDEVDASLDWSSVFIKLNNNIVPRNAEHFPVLAALVSQMPFIVNAFFSHLGPGSVIAPHRGYSKSFLRYHLGILIPDGQQCYLEVDGIKHYWELGKGVVFDDMFVHSAYNHSTQDRVVLYIDFHRPLPFPYGWLIRKISNLLMNNSFVKKLEKKVNE
ncbi:Aspartyl/Asparaginyl beta-hydroxylase [Legionella massiliensis]|uniref:Aspartyl/Asparaginyl beta-hydroxylase n=1 Tax=Legionella massiliensis TaxID=1034943 RepID=A0A078L220_9GAMM|nr:aspartyl/asparaginyl beta-hydroxylase domain-containing protein [Legionella massiliensis]CDZ79287.1 Aspartyl/Asparaginyl beta-hydroxylase [Legionella massiliensis]CEE15025.1 Aspartyl/Asparaginyl beta-hydroxylase [Legionella massiliensis]